MRQGMIAATAFWCAALVQAQPPMVPDRVVPPPAGASFNGRPLEDAGALAPNRLPELPGVKELAPGPAPPPPAPPASAVSANLITFDPRQAELHWKDNRWQLLAGGVLLKDFGRRQIEGREVLRLVRELGLTQLGTVGTPQPVMEYWLAGGRAPQRPESWLRLSPLDRASLRVEQFQGQWCVRDGPRVLFNFGSHPEEAEQALAVIRRYGFTHVGSVGQLPPAMVLFVSISDGAAPPPVATPASFVPRTSSPGSPPPAPVAPAGQRGHGTDGMGQPAKASLPSSDRGPPFSSAGQPPAGMRNPVVPEELPHGRQFGANELRPDLTNLAESVSFDWRQVRVRRDGQDWKLVFGSHVLANLGPNERDARQALSAVQHYRFNQHCLVGRPTPVFSYFLANGRAPQGTLVGVNRTPFRPEALTVRQSGDHWVIGDPTQTLLDFGDRVEEARQTLRAIQRHRFDHLCRIGQSAPAPLTFMVRAR